jgi:serine/threonine-protein kinase HipA
VSTAIYAPPDDPEELGLKFGGGKRFSDVRLDTFVRLQGSLENRFGLTGADLGATAEQTVQRIREHWQQTDGGLEADPSLRGRIDELITTRTRSLLGR